MAIDTSFGGALLATGADGTQLAALETGMALTPAGHDLQPTVRGPVDGLDQIFWTWVGVYGSGAVALIPAAEGFDVVGVFPADDNDQPRTSFPKYLT